VSIITFSVFVWFFRAVFSSLPAYACFDALARMRQPSKQGKQAISSASCGKFFEKHESPGIEFAAVYFFIAAV
jgi:hypothetical protein